LVAQALQPAASALLPALGGADHQPALTKLRPTQAEATPEIPRREAGIYLAWCDTQNEGIIHNHMTHEEPRYVFLHFWGKGPAAALAGGLKSALETQGR
jgi:hypothetical protein